MARPIIVTRGDLEARYPGVELGDFKPSHAARIRGREHWDFVALRPEGTRGISFGYEPGQDEATYAEIPGGKWQHLNAGGIVESDLIRWDANWIPLHERDGNVYFVESGEGGPIKIGWSQDVERRIGELQVANAHKLHLLGVVPGTMKKEGELHAKFAHVRMEAEWFQNTEEIHKYLRKNGR